MSKTENQRRILTKCPFLAHSEKFPRDLAKVQKNLWCWLMYGTKYMLPLQGFFQLVQGFKKYEPKGWFGKRAHPGSLMSYNKKRWEIRYGLMVSMWKMAQNGGNWSKIEKCGFHHRKWVEKPARNKISVLFLPRFIKWTFFSWNLIFFA